MSSLATLFPVVLISGLAVCLITLVSTEFGIIVLIFSMLLSPELPIAQVSQRAVVVRIDDILIFVVFFTWLAKMAMNKELGLFRKSPLNLPIISFICINILSTLFGIISGPTKPLPAFFYILKYIEYFMIYFLIINNLYNKKQPKKFVAFLLITCFIVCVITSAQIGRISRTTAPFERGDEPNTLGGYLLLLFAISLGIFLYSKAGIWKFSTAFLCLLIIPPFLYTYSRGSYLAFVPMYLTFIILTKKMKPLFIIFLLLFVIIAPSVLPLSVIERIKATFTPGRIYEPLGTRITLDYSASQRVENWKNVFKRLKDSPIFGFGVTGMGPTDSQIPLVLAETGIVGFWIFVWLMSTVFINAIKTFKNVDDNWCQGLTLGFLAGFVGLLIHAFSAETFIIVRIMEPFWFLAAIVTSLPALFTEKVAE